MFKFIQSKIHSHSPLIKGAPHLRLLFDQLLLKGREKHLHLVTYVHFHQEILVFKKYYYKQRLFFICLIITKCCFPTTFTVKLTSKKTNFNIIIQRLNLTFIIIQRSNAVLIRTTISLLSDSCNFNPHY